MARSSERPVVFIVGPTGSGKTALAIELARLHGAEIICADSRTVYRHLDIGTAKPTIEEQNQVKHHLIDVVNPDENFTAAMFQQNAKTIITELHGKKKIPFVVGGTGLYIDSLLFDYSFKNKGDEKLRNLLQQKTIDELINYCITSNIELPINRKNKRHLIRAIEQKGINRQRQSRVDQSYIVVGIATNKIMLRCRLEKRAEMIFSQSVIQEAVKVAEQYGWASEAMTGNIYPLIRSIVEGQLTIEEAKKKFITLDWRLAKRQLTWFKRNPAIHWLPYEAAKQYISKELLNRNAC